MPPYDRIIFRFDPDAPGMEKFVGPLEALALQILWDNAPITAKRLQYFLNQKKKYAYTTVTTVLTNLVQKGFLTREKSGHSFVYRPAISRDDFLKMAAEKIISELNREFPNVTTRILKSYKKK